MVTISGGGGGNGEDGGAPNGTMNNISSVIQTVLAAQLVSRSGIGDEIFQQGAARAPQQVAQAQQAAATGAPAAQQLPPRRA
jgi:hypothetical protein